MFELLNLKVEMAQICTHTYKTNTLGQGPE